MTLLAALALAGCGTDSKPATTSASSTTAPAAPSPSPSFATENEVASVIAGYEKDWREVAEKAGPCRFKYVLKEDGPLAQTERMTCYTNEVTAAISAKNAMRDLAQLDVPPSMTPLVEETNKALQLLVDADLESACGPAMQEPNGTKKCDTAMGAQMLGYDMVTNALDKWGPYL